jgi:RNA polymerase sigma-70 factor, ECF subfamily
MGDGTADTEDPARPRLREVLVAQYDALLRKLTRRLGSDLADDVLHDAWLRLDNEPDPAAVRDPFAYVLRVAVNLAADRRARTKRQSELLGGAPIDKTDGDIADDVPGPAEVAEAREDLRALARAIETMPERRRAIVVAAFTENVTHRELAARYGVTIRTIQIELKKALADCARLTGRH